MTKEKFKTKIKKITPAEWIISLIGTFLFLFTLLYILYTAIFNSSSPPDINLRILSIQQNNKDYLVIIEAENRGDKSVEGLEVEVVLTQNNAEEKGRTIFDYVPGNSKRKGGVFFKINPEEYEIELHPLGFEEP